MIYIDKSSKESLEIKQKLEDWKSLHREYLENSYSNPDIKAGVIWDILDNNRTDEINRRILREIFLKEQGFLCGYCGSRINFNNSQIEHIKPKSEYRNHTYDYDNLILSCYGCTKDIIHTVSKQTESIESIAKYWGVTKEDIEELYLDEERKKLINKEYDLDAIMQGDSIWIIKRKQESQHHCGHKKSDNFHYGFISPTMYGCEQQFKYKKDSGYIIGTSDNADKTIDLLGLNNNKKLNTYRTDSIKRGLDLRKRILEHTGKDKAKYQNEKNKFITKLSEKKDDHYNPYFFIAVAVLEDRLIA